MLVNKKKNHKNLKMSGEWLKSSIAELIKAYKLQENLYNQKHKLYYNKQARNNSLNKILTTVQVNDAKFYLTNSTISHFSFSATGQKLHSLK